MKGPKEPLALADWRRRIAELYAKIRPLAQRDPTRARKLFEVERDGLFRSHPSTPLADHARRGFRGLGYYPYRFEWRLVGRVEPFVSRSTIEVDGGTDGAVRLVRIARVDFTAPRGESSLELYWVDGYGGGIFLPFADTTNGMSTFGGGRYLYDTTKGADLGLSENEIILDFNFAYNPSCAYNPAWICPLPPSNNRLPFDIDAGERMREAPSGPRS